MDAILRPEMTPTNSRRLGMTYRVERIEQILNVPSVEEAAAWYERVLGWKGHYDVFDMDGRCTFGSVSHTGGAINLSRSVDPNLQREDWAYPFTLFIAVDDVDAVHGMAVQNGEKVLSSPADQFWGGRTFSMRDLNGFGLTFYQMVESPPLEEIRRRHKVSTGQS
jgi:uncharacterized glyoxalase superfamily protein PhnB